MDTEYCTNRDSAAKETKNEFMKGKTGRYFSIEEYGFINGILSSLFSYISIATNRSLVNYHFSVPEEKCVCYM